MRRDLRRRFRELTTLSDCPWTRQKKRKKPLEVSSASHLSSPSTNHTKGLAAQRLFTVPSCRKGTIHLQTSMSSPGFKPSVMVPQSYVGNLHTSWEI
ncbi:hypothetical protein TNCV_3365431 [Trichonephila clavipes]|nr:hypothetical protein TNCV_3365431 [Trichonephila clavipes]